MKANEILATLKTLAPSVVFTVSREIDENEVWDGDGPDPREDGYEPYNVDVAARAIHNGEMLEGSTSLGSSYYQDDEPIDDAHGYLPQMLREAADELMKEIQRVQPVSIGKPAVLSQLEAVGTFLTTEMRRQYDEQRASMRRWDEQSHEFSE